jgi:FixJ family two-component response regulator
MTEPASEPVVAVVDDDPGVLRSVEYLLESAGYSTRLFASGAELLDSGCLPHIHCLISDVDMPGMQGDELLRVVRASRPQLPVILITGYADRLAPLSALGMAHCRCFSKPFQGPELLSAIGECISKRRLSGI